MACLRAQPPTSAHAGSGPDLDDDVARGRGGLEELAHQARLADAHVADDPGPGERARLGPAAVEPREVLLAPDERQGRLDERDATGGAGSVRALLAARWLTAGGGSAEMRPGRVVIWVPVIAAPHSPQNFCVAGIGRAARWGRPRSPRRAAGRSGAPSIFARAPASARAMSSAVLEAVLRLLGEGLEGDLGQGVGDLALGRELARVDRGPREVGEHDLRRASRPRRAAGR